jgi:hypothetical protein
MKLPDNIAHRILNHAKRANLQGAPPTVTSLCKDYGFPMTSWLRKTVAKLLDAEGVPRRRSPRSTAEQSSSVGAQEFGQKFESLSRVFVDIKKLRSVIRYFGRKVISRPSPTEIRKVRLTT